MVLLTSVSCSLEDSRGGLDLLCTVNKVRTMSAFVIDDHSLIAMVEVARNWSVCTHSFASDSSCYPPWRRSFRSLPIRIAHRDCAYSRAWPYPFCLRTRLRVPVCSLRGGRKIACCACGNACVSRTVARRWLWIGSQGRRIAMCGCPK